MHTEYTFSILQYFRLLMYATGKSNNCTLSSEKKKSTEIFEKVQ